MTSRSWSCFAVAVALALTGCGPVVEDARGTGAGGASALGEAAGGGGASGAAEPSGPVELAHGLPFPAGIALDATRVFWTNTGRWTADGSVMAVAKGGGARSTLAAGQRSPSGVAIAGAAVLWTEVVPLENASGTLLRLDLTGDATIEPLAVGLAQPAALAVVDERAVVTGTYSLTSVPAGGGGVPTTLGSELGPCGGGGLAVDGDAAYSAWEITRVPFDGSPPVRLAVSLRAAGVARDGEFVYATVGSIYAETAAALVRIPINGGPPEALASGLDNGGGVAVDDEFVYWTERGTYEDAMCDGAVKRVSKGGGVVTTLAARQHAPAAIAVDDEAVYWTNAGDPAAADGSVMKVMK